MRLLITGGYGFIGSNFIRYLISRYPDYEIINLDALTYAANRDNLRDIEGRENYTFVHATVEDPVAVKEVMRGVDAVVHFAAESHVDRSILEAQPFLKTNILGTQVLMDSARSEGVKRFVHISTDEVYGSHTTDEGSFTEESALKPNSPYAASKAGADLLVRAYVVTHKLPAIIIRASNNYGPYQFPEKFIPLMITNLLEGKRIPLYGSGLNIRDWLYVEDTCRAIDLVLHRGTIGRIYNVGAGEERRNIEVVRAVLGEIGLGEEWIEFVPDRPGHDYRYSIDSTLISQELGWKPKVDFAKGIALTIRWYKENTWWWEPLKRRLESESRGFWTRK